MGRLWFRFGATLSNHDSSAVDRRGRQGSLEYLCPGLPQKTDAVRRPFRIQGILPVRELIAPNRWIR